MPSRSGEFHPGLSQSTRSSGRPGHELVPGDVLVRRQPSLPVGRNHDPFSRGFELLFHRTTFARAARGAHEGQSRQSESANPRIRLTVFYRETETGKRLMGRALAISIIADVPITDLR
jgi:hypothetical protein